MSMIVNDSVRIAGKLGIFVAPLSYCSEELRSSLRYEMPDSTEALLTKESLIYANEEWIVSANGDNVVLRKHE